MYDIPEDTKVQYFIDHVGHSKKDNSDGRNYTNRVDKSFINKGRALSIQFSTYCWL